MNSQDNDQPIDAQAPATEEAPKKKRAPRKTAAAKAEEAGAEASAAAPAEAVEGAEPAPKKRAPRKKAVAAEESSAALVEQAAAPAPAPAPAPVAAEAAPVEARSESRADDGGNDGDEGGEGGSEASAEGEGEGGERRGRNRRNRNRNRDKDRPEFAPAGVETEPPAPEVLEAAGARFSDLLTGSFDTDAEQGEIAEPVEASAGAEDGEQDDEGAEGDTKRVLAPEPDAPKLQKVLGQAGVGSRRDIEDMIAQGKIEVNGEVAHIGQRISFGDRVSVNGKPVKIRIQPPTPRILAYHKPTGEVVTFNDPEGRPTVFRTLPRVQGSKWQSIGRLDINTEGLLLFTNNGELANQLMHPRFGVEREYAARVLGSLSNEQRDKLLAGVEIEGQACAFKAIEDGGGEGVNRWYRVTITEGRNREVRKLFESVGMAVSRLIRIRYGTVVLPRGLRRGVWVELGDNDVAMIRRLAGHQDRPRHEQQQQQRDDKKKRRPDRNAGPRPSRPEARQDRPDREDRQGRPERAERERYPDQPQHQPQQHQQNQQPRRDHDDEDDDFIPRNINPLEQTFDRRFATGSKRIPQGFGAGGSAQDHGQGGGGGGGNRGGNKGKGGGQGGGQGGQRQPDPMQTSVGYIGADAYRRGGGGGRRGGGGGGGGGGGRGGRGR